MQVVQLGTRGIIMAEELVSERDKAREAYSDTLLELAKKTSERDRLLEALDGIIEAADIAGYSTQRGLLAQRINVARAAIAKARGTND
jgi:hypothetical protein